jgi:16S rRNA (guanine966-N2)-methyltransferase
LFSILGSRVGAARVLDLYAGSGALGFESLSRGAAHVTFVESHRPTAAALIATARQLGVDERCTVMMVAAERVSARLTEPVDLVFADPPYAMPYPAGVFAALRARGIVTPASLVIYEHSSALAPPVDPGFAVIRAARYGAVALAFLTTAA